MGKNIRKNVSKKLSGKYSQKSLDHAKQSAKDAFKTASKSADPVVKSDDDKRSSTALQSNPKTASQTSKKSIVIPKERYITKNNWKLLIR